MKRQLEPVAKLLGDALDKRSAIVALLPGLATLTAYGM